MSAAANERAIEQQHPCAAMHISCRRVASHFTTHVNDLVLVSGTVVPLTSKSYNPSDHFTVLRVLCTRADPGPSAPVARAR